MNAHTGPDNDHLFSFYALKTFAMDEDSFIEKGREAVGLTTGSYISLVLPGRGRMGKCNSSRGGR
jgi:hypothetical protein